jgi:hypothetical protein
VNYRQLDQHLCEHKRLAPFIYTPDSLGADPFFFAFCINYEILAGMPGTAATANLPARIQAPHTGVYVVSHRNPAHTVPHEVSIVVPMILPHCKVCGDLRYSLKALPAEPIRDNEFFREHDDE